MQSWTNAAGSSSLNANGAEDLIRMDKYQTVVNSYLRAIGKTPRIDISKHKYFPYPQAQVDINLTFRIPADNRRAIMQPGNARFRALPAAISKAAAPVLSYIYKYNCQVPYATFPVFHCDFDYWSGPFRL